jgi:hypothetical protein
MPDIEPRTASVATLISEIDNGRVAETADLKLTELVAAVEATGRKGTVTITLTVRREGTVAAVGAAVKVSIPITPTREELYHFAGGGELSKEDPRQLVIPTIGRKPA